MYFNLVNKITGLATGASISGGGSVFGIFTLLIFLIIFIATYLYFSYAWMIIARKLEYNKSWLAWIPFFNVILFLQLGGFHWAWIFLLLIPILGWIPLGILLIIATWKIFERRNYPGWFSLSLIIPSIGGILYLIAIGFVAWKDKEELREEVIEEVRERIE